MLLEEVGILVDKKNMKIYRVALICGTIAIALNLIGVGYAAWNEGVSINSTISTGSIDVIFSNVNFNNNPNGDKEDNGNKKSNDIKLDFNSDTILVSGTMYYNNDIVLKYEVMNNGTLPVDISSVSNEKYEFENGGFIIVNPDSGTIKIHIPKVDEYYDVTVPLKFKAKFGSWEEILYIKLGITVEQKKDKENPANDEMPTTSTSIEQEISEPSFNDAEVKEEYVKAADNNIKLEDTLTKLEKDILIELKANTEEIHNNVELDKDEDIIKASEEDSKIEKINKIFYDLSDAIVVESKSNN